MYGLKQRSKQDESGLIQGAGTGTSDSIKKNVPAGSYIMPADSTARLGARNLGKMGKSTEVNVSNGEYLLPPEQLQAIGGEVLQSLKQQTHVPVEKQGFGFRSQAKPIQSSQGEPTKLGLNPSALAQYHDNIKIGKSGKPEFFFFNGTDKDGVPDEEAKKRMLQPGTMTSGDFTGQRNTATALQPKAAITPQPQTQAAPVNTPQPQATPTQVTHSTLAERQEEMRGKSFGEQLFHKLGGRPDPVGQMSLKAQQAAQPQTQAAITPQPQTQAAPVNTPQPQATTTTDKQATTPGNKSVVDDRANTITPPPDTQIQPDAAKPAPSVFDMGVSGQNTDVPATNPDPYAIEQKENSFSYANPNAAAQARAAGIPEMQGFGLRMKSSGDPVGVKNLLANTREMGASEQQIQNALAQREMNIGMQGYGGIPRQPSIPQRTPEQEAERQSVIRAASTPIAGARGLTANQVRTLSDLQQGEDNRANQRYTTDANNSAALQREAMGQAGQNYRTELGEQGANNRFNANLGFEAQKFGATNDLANRQLSEEQLNNMPARMKQQAELYYMKQYEQAKTPEEKQEANSMLAMLRGQQSEQQKRSLKSVYGGQTLTDQGAIRNPDILIDEATGERVDYGATQLQPIDQNPAAVAIKNNKNLSYDEKTTQLAALGYSNT